MPASGAEHRAGLPAFTLSSIVSQNSGTETTSRRSRVHRGVVGLLVFDDVTAALSLSGASMANNDALTLQIDQPRPHRRPSRVRRRRPTRAASSCRCRLESWMRFLRAATRHHSHRADGLIFLTGVIGSIVTAAVVSSHKQLRLHRRRGSRSRRRAHGRRAPRPRHPVARARRARRPTRRCHPGPRSPCRSGSTPTPTTSSRTTRRSRGASPRSPGTPTTTRCCARSRTAGPQGRGEQPGRELRLHLRPARLRPRRRRIVTTSMTYDALYGTGTQSRTLTFSTRLRNVS